VKVLADLKKTWKTLNEGLIGTIFYCLLGLLVAVSVHWGLGFAMNTDLPIVTVSSTSMVPNLNVGDIVFIKGEETYDLGDVIVFNGWETEPIIHRIVAYSENGEVFKYDNWNQMENSEILKYKTDGKIYITKGDNNPSCDQCGGKQPVTEQDVHGKQVLVIPYLGWVKILFVKYFVNTPIIGMGALIVLAITYWLYKKW